MKSKNVLFMAAEIYTRKSSGGIGRTSGSGLGIPDEVCQA